MTALLGGLVDQACPPWCELPDGHPYDDGDPVAGTVNRTHRWVALETPEVLVEISGMVELEDGAALERYLDGDPSIGLVVFEGGRPTHVDLTADQARALALVLGSALELAASHLEAVELS